MIRLRFYLYVTLMVVTAPLAALLVEWPSLGGLSARHCLGLAVFILLGLVSEHNALSIKIGRNVSSTSITFILVFASIVLFGPAGSLLFVFGSGIITEFLIRRKPLVKASFNVAQYSVATTLSSQVYSLLGGAWSPDAFVFDPWPFLVFSISLIALNQIFVAIGLALREHLRFRRVLSEVSGEWGSNVIYDLFVSPVALLVSFLYVHLYIWGLIFVLLLLEFIRLSYLTKLRLQGAIKDLTRALVKAIETRDPYTSGHSLRVSALARLCAETLHLSPRQVSDIETAALLHDIGKIDVVYEEILMKPGHLSPLEREMIQSHVQKGVDLLRSLSSFDEDVISSVRHHHERFDGEGYPDQLKGHSIPLGARIIKVCDAIDAMLSDRPYRNALALPAVREQLSIYAGSQFDPDVVSAILEADLLERHGEQLSIGSRLRPAFDRKASAKAPADPSLKLAR